MGAGPSGAPQRQNLTLGRRPKGDVSFAGGDLFGGLVSKASFQADELFDLSLTKPSLINLANKLRF